MGRAIAACVVVSLFLLGTAPPAAAAADAAAAAAATQPVAADVKITAAAITERDYRKALLDFNRRTLGDAYKTAGKRDPKWNEPATKLLDAVAVYFTNATAPMGHRMPGQPIKNLQGYGKAAVDAGCDDAIVLYCYGAILDDANKDAEALPLLKRAAELIPRSGYPINRAFSAARRMAAHADRQQDDAAAAQYHQMTRDFALASVSATGQFKGLDRRIVLALVRDWFEELPVDQQKSFCDDAAKGNADPWMLDVLSGDYHRNAGWLARGKKFAVDVTEQGAREFHARLAQAATRYVAAWKREPGFPEPAGAMIGVAMAGEVAHGDERTWFARATAAQFDYLPAYSRMFNALLPRWGGSHRRMFEFGLACAATGRYDTRVPWMLVEAVEKIDHDDRDVHMSGTTDVWSREGVYEKVRDVLTRYAADAADEADRAFYRSYLAGLAWQMGEYRESGQLVAQMGARLQKDAMRRAGLLPQRMTGAFDAAAGPHAAVLTRAENAARHGDHAAALKLYEGLAAKIAAPAPGATWVRNRVRELTWQVAFAAGEAVDLMPAADDADDALPGWYATGGAWKRDKAGFLYGANDGSGLTILCGGDFGKRFELTGRVELDPNPALREVSVGPILAWSAAGRDQQVVLRKKAQAVVVRRNATPVAKFPTPLATSNTFAFQVYDGAAWGGVNGKRLFNALDLADFSVEDPTLIGVGGQRTSQLRVRYKDLKVRKLTEKPADAATRPAAPAAAAAKSPAAKPPGSAAAGAGAARP